MPVAILLTDEFLIAPSTVLGQSTSLSMTHVSTRFQVRFAAKPCVLFQLSAQKMRQLHFGPR